MNSRLILNFLSDIARNNDREWFQANRDRYDAARSAFELGVGQAINRIAGFDEQVANVTVKDATYRFHRDTRFSPDKSPYKNHFGAYINAHGKKALRGGYYLHVEPGQCMVAVGNYWLPTNILTACRNEMMGNTEEWLACVETADFRRFYGSDGPTDPDAPQGFGLSRLKTCPAGFPRDWPHVQYLRMKDYCAWHRVGDDFFEGEAWLDRVETMFRAAKPMMDFVNNVIDDYE